MISNAVCDKTSRYYFPFFVLLFNNEYSFPFVIFLGEKKTQVGGKKRGFRVFILIHFLCKIF